MKNKKNLSSYPTGLITGILITILILILLPTLTSKLSLSNINLPFLPKPTPTLTPQGLQDKVTKEVLPESLNLGVSFKDTIVKMVQYGAIDKDKFLPLYQDNQELSKEANNLLDSPNNNPITVNQKNSTLILNLLWPLGISNQTKVLSDGPMGTQYKDTVGNFASTGGWNIGKEDGGKLFNSFNLIQLTPDQEAQVKEIAQNIYRPCCGNSTYFPDCNHGAAMLGFLELAVSQGMPKDEIYKKALVLNSYWFPQTYVEDAIYMQKEKGISWDKVDPKEALGAQFSSGQGFATIDKNLQDKGLIPKVSGGSSC